MEISHELILGPEDFDQFSIKCKSCKTVLVVSLSALTLTGDRAAKKTGQADMPTKCPSCDEDWATLYGAVRDFRGPSRNSIRSEARLAAHTREPEMKPTKGQ